MSSIRLRYTAVTALLSVAIAGAASAAPLYQSAANSGNDTGEYILSGNDLIGGVFTLSGTTNITAIGAQFGGFPGGNIFGAIVAVDAHTGLPAGASNDLASTALGHVLFSVTGGVHDQSAALPLTLGAGTYAVVFGSGQFGATGWAGLGYLNDPVGSPSLVRSFFSTGWSSFNDDGVRVFVDGTAASPAPEMATWGMLLIGFGGIGGAMRMRRRSVHFA
jgi:hypothetical protein